MVQIVRLLGAELGACASCCRSLLWLLGLALLSLFFGSAMLGCDEEEEQRRVADCGQPSRSVNESARQETRAADFPQELELSSLAGGLPIIVVDTGGQAVLDEPRIEATLSVYESLDRPPLQTEQIRIELRGGFFSMLFDKKQFGLSTKDEHGDKLDVSFLGMPEDDDWILSSSAGDQSMLRNYVGYSIGAWMGLLVPETRYVELLLNQSGEALAAGDYLGPYLLTENILQHKARMGLELDAGGFLVEFTSMDVVWPEESFICAPWAVSPLIVHYPKELAPGSAELAAIEDRLYAFEERMFESGRGSLESMIDVESAVNYWLLNEALMNEDSFARSVFLHSPDGGRLVFGPVWDLDFAMRAEPTKMLVPNNMVENDWARGLLAHDFFFEMVVQRWHSLRATVLTDEAIEALIDETWARIGAAVDRNETLWQLGEQSPEEEKDELKSWLLERFAWLDAHIEEARAALH